MSKILAIVSLTLSAVDAVITRVISRFWISTLQSQLRYGRELQH